MVTDGKERLLAPFLLKFVSKDDNITILEGYQFTHQAVKAAFEAAAKKAGFRVVFLDLPSA